MRDRKVSASHPMGADRRQRVRDKTHGMQEKLEELENEDNVKAQKAQKLFAPEDLAGLKSLVFLGRNSDVVEFSGYKFELMTLTSSETREVVAELANRGVKMAAYVKICTLAKSIKAINNNDFIDLYEGEEELSDYHKKIAIIDEWQISLINALYEKYEELANNSDAVFKDEELIDKIKK